jgi:hypothetical protein
VFKKVEDYNNFTQACKDSAKIYGNSFTYTLIEEKDLRKHLDGGLFIDRLFQKEKINNVPI